VRLHVLVEGPSEQAFMSRWARRLLRDHSVKVYPHQGKGTLPTDLGARPNPRNRALLHQLPAKLRAFANALDAKTEKVLVLVDADDDNCARLTRSISEAARRIAPALEVLVRVAIEETEAFYLGDLNALKRAFPDADMARARAYAPDSVCGTWELFGAIVHDGGGNKVAWAEAMGARVTTVAAKSRSPSFRALHRGLLRLVSSLKPASRARRKYAHRAPKKRGGSGRR
jgi:hypothetical protein